MDAHPTAHADEHAHPTPGTYAKIGLFLFVLTALEVGLYEGTYGEHAGAFGASLQPFFVPLLLALSAIKFALVAMYYMHLKFEPPRLVVMVLAPIPLAILITATVVMMEIR